MKTMKVALLATAALAAVSVSARADETADLKAQLEALNARVAQLEVAPAAPVGYSLLTVNNKGTATVIRGVTDTSREKSEYGTKATVVGVIPTADAPPATTIEWSGYVRAAIIIAKKHGEKDEYGGRARGELKVLAKTDTSVGEVGAYIKIRGDYRDWDSHPTVKMPEAWGYWNMTPEFVLGGGYVKSLGNINYGYDGACTCYYTDNADLSFSPGNSAQMRLTYLSGPLEMAIAIEDASHDDNFGKKLDLTGRDNYDSHGFWGDNKAWGGSARIAYAGEWFSGELSGVYHDHGKKGIKTPAGKFLGRVKLKDSWQVAAGGKVGLGDVVDLSLAGGLGRLNSGQKFWSITGLASAEIDDAIRAEVGVGYRHYKKHVSTGWSRRRTQVAGLAGLYYDPVDQLTIGLEGELINPKGKHNDAGMVDLVTVFRF